MVRWRCAISLIDAEARCGYALTYEFLRDTRHRRRARVNFTSSSFTARRDVSGFKCLRRASMSPRARHATVGYIATMPVPVGRFRRHNAQSIIACPRGAAGVRRTIRFMKRGLDMLSIAYAASLRWPEASLATPRHLHAASIAISMSMARPGPHERWRSSSGRRRWSGCGRRDRRYLTIVCFFCLLRRFRARFGDVAARKTRVDGEEASSSPVARMRRYYQLALRCRP